MSDLVAASQHECFRMGVMAGISLCAVVASVVGWLLIFAAESNWTDTPEDSE